MGVCCSRRGSLLGARGFSPCLDVAKPEWGSGDGSGFGLRLVFFGPWVFGISFGRRVSWLLGAKSGVRRELSLCLNDFLIELAGGAHFDFLFCSHLQPLAATCKWPQVAASGCKWLPTQVAASGCKWLPKQVADKWLLLLSGEYQDFSTQLWRRPRLHQCCSAELATKKSYRLYTKNSA